jgi:hypothetical protein
MITRRSLAAVVLGIGATGVILARVAQPVGPTLYDGVVPIEPYRWLDPPTGAQGGAKGSRATVEVQGARSPVVAIATPEQPPQAQLFAQPGGLTLPAGTQSLTLSITPVEAASAPPNGSITGNVYRISVANQAGAAVTAPASARVSVLLRAPDATLAEGTIDELVGNTWQALHTSPAGFGGTFLVTITAFGDFALIGAGPTASLAASSGAVASTASSGTSPAAASVTSALPGASGSSSAAGTGGPSPLLPIGLAVGAVLLAFVVGAVLRSRPGRSRR